MSGHSKWATIHRKKGLIDAESGKIFQNGIFNTERLEPLKRKYKLA